MKNKIIIPTILLIAILIFSFFALSQEKTKSKRRQASRQTKKANKQVKSYFFTAMVAHIVRLLRNTSSKTIFMTKFLLPKEKFITIKTTPKN